MSVSSNIKVVVIYADYCSLPQDGSTFIVATFYAIQEFEQTFTHAYMICYLFLVAEVRLTGHFYYLAALVLLIYSQISSRNIPCKIIFTGDWDVDLVYNLLCCFSFIDQKFDGDFY